MNKINPLTVNDLSIATDTIEHRMRGIKAPLADSLENCFAVVQRPTDKSSKETDPNAGEAIVELLTVSEDNQLLHVKRDSFSETGWRADKVSMPKIRKDGQTISGKIRQISAFYQGDRIYAMVHYPGPDDTHVVVAMVYQEDQGWQELYLQGDVANALYSTRQTDVYRTPNGYHFFYGVSTAYERPQFFVVFETGTDGVWAAVNETVENPGATYRLLPGASADRYGHTLLEMHANGITSREFFLKQDSSGYYIEWGSELAAAKLPGGDLNASNVYAFPSRIGAKSLLLHTDDKQLHYVAGYCEDDLRHKSLTGGSNQPAVLESICIGRDRFNRCTVFAISARDRRLWVLRQTGMDSNNDLTFADWICLGNLAGVIGCPRAMLDGAELFLVNPNSRELLHMRQNQDTTIWHHNRIKVAVNRDITAEKTTVHAVDILAIAENNVPVPLAALELQSDVTTDVTINGFVRQLTSETWLKANADMTGKLSLTMNADNLTAPNIRIRVSATGQVFTANPDSKVASRLKGKDPRIKLDVMNMRKAGLIPDGVQGEAANDVVRLIREVGKASERSEGGAPSSTGKAQQFTVDAGAVGTQCVRKSEVGIDSIGAGAEMYSQTMPQSEPVKIAEKKPNKVIKLVGDVINWLENAWENVKKFVVTVANDVVRLVLTIGDKVHEFVVNTAEGIVRAFESVIQGIAEMFRKAGETIVKVAEKIVKFIQALFGWEDILVCNDVLQLTVNGVLDSAEQFFSVEAINWVQGCINDMKSGVDDIFDQLEQAVGPLDPREEQVRQGQDSALGSLQSSMKDNRVATDTVQNQMQRHPDPISDATKSVTERADDPFKDFVNLVESSYKDNVEQKFTQALESFNPTSLDDLFDQGLNTAIKALRPLIHFAIDVGGNLLQLGLRMVGKIIAMLKEILNTVIEIPIVSDFYQEHSNGRQLKIMDIATLLIAAPLTIIYKLVFGGKDLDPPFTATQLQEFKNAPFSWGDLMSALSVVSSGGKTASAVDNRSVGAKYVGPVGNIDVAKFAIKEAVELIKTAAPLMRQIVKPFTIAAGLFEFAYGVIASFKHGADTHDLTGTAGNVATVIGYVGKVVRFALTVPGLLIMFNEYIEKYYEDMSTLTIAEFFAKLEADNEPLSLPMILSAGTLLFTLIGLGLTINKAGVPVTRIVDTIAGIIIFVLAAYTVVALIHNGIVSGDGLQATTEGMTQISTLFSAIPGMFAWMVLSAAAANTAVPGSGEAVLIFLVAVEIICDSVSGFSTIMSIALPGLYGET